MLAEPSEEVGLLGRTEIKEGVGKALKAGRE